MKCADGRACGSRVAPAMPLPVLEDGTSDESVPPARVCTTSEGLTEQLRASIAWASRPAVVHAANRALDVDAPAILTPRVADLDRHERAFVTRRTRRSMRGAA